MGICFIWLVTETYLGWLRFQFGSEWPSQEGPCAIGPDRLPRTEAGIVKSCRKKTGKSYGWGRELMVRL